MFADNTNMFIAHDSVDQLTSLANRVHVKVSNWLRIYNLSSNIKKTHIMLFLPR